MTEHKLINVDADPDSPRMKKWRKREDIENPPHYAKYGIEPKEYIMTNGLGWCEGNVVKYITRWRDKGGVDDLRKAREFISMLIEKETKERVEV